MADEAAEQQSAEQTEQGAPKAARKQRKAKSKPKAAKRGASKKEGKGTRMKRTVTAGAGEVYFTKCAKCGGEVDGTVRKHYGDASFKLREHQAKGGGHKGAEMKVRKGEVRERGAAKKPAKKKGGKKS